MKAAIYRGPNAVVAGDWPEPILGPGDLLVRLRACGLGVELRRRREAIKVLIQGASA